MTDRRFPKETAKEGIVATMILTTTISSKRPTTPYSINGLFSCTMADTLDSGEVWHYGSAKHGFDRPAAVKNKPLQHLATLSTVPHHPFTPRFSRSGAVGYPGSGSVSIMGRAENRIDNPGSGAEPHSCLWCEFTKCYDSFDYIQQPGYVAKHFHPFDSSSKTIDILSFICGRV